MSEMLLDGTGSGKLAKVDGSNRLRTFGVTNPLIDDVLISEGKTFYGSRGVGTLSTGGTTEYCVFEIYNNNNEAVMVYNFQMWLSPALTNATPGSYAEAADQWVRINQWIGRPTVSLYDNVTLSAGILENLNATSSEEFTGAITIADDTDAIAIPPKDTANGYICGFHTKATGSKVEMLPQPAILGKGDRLLVSIKPTQYNAASSVIKHEFGFRASLVLLGSLDE